MPSIDGLGSGLDTTSIINQLMALERQPKDRLVAQRLSVLSRGTAWGQIGAALTAVKTAADSLTSTGALGAATATSTTPATATVTVATGASPGLHTLGVQALATAGSYGLTVDSPTAVVGAGSLTVTRGTAALGLTAVSAPAGATPPAGTGSYAVEVRSVSDGSAEVVVNGVVSTVDTSNGTFSVGGLEFSAGSLVVGKAEVTVARTGSDTATVADLAAALNAAGGVASAAVVTSTDPQTGAATTRLLLSSTATGTAGALTSSADGLSGLGAQTEIRAAADARLTLDGLTDIVRSSNRVDDLLPGVTLNLVTAGGPETTIGIARDPATAGTAMKALVTALNSALGTITTNTRYDVAAKKGGPLTGDSIARSLSGRLHDVVSEAGAGAATTLGALGLGLQRDGTYAFDAAAFSASLAKDPAATSALVGELTSRLGALAKEATAYDGVTRTGAAGATDQAARMQVQLTAYDQRLSLTQDRLRRQFSTLDTALGSLRNQSSWLAGQLSTLNRS